MVLEDEVMLGSVGPQTMTGGGRPSAGVELRRSESPPPYPLPMPAYGGYFAPLNELLPESLPPTVGFHRSNISVMYLCDLVLDGLQVCV